MVSPRVRVVRSPEAAQRRLEEINRQFRGEGKVQVGLPRGSNAYPDGTSVIMVGAVHEFGSPSRNIPQRSYLRSTLVENKRDYKRLFRKLSRKIIRGEITKEQALGILGLQLQGDVREKITDIKDPPLKTSPRPASRNSPGGGDNPLLDTGHLRQSITFQIGD